MSNNLNNLVVLCSWCFRLGQQNGPLRTMIDSHAQVADEILKIWRNNKSILQACLIPSAVLSVSYEVGHIMDNPCSADITLCMINQLNIINAKSRKDGQMMTLTLQMSSLVCQD